MYTEGQQVTITKPSVRAEHGTFTITAFTDAGLRALLVDASGEDLGYAVDIYNLTPADASDELAEAHAELATAERSLSNWDGKPAWNETDALIIKTMTADAKERVSKARTRIAEITAAEEAAMVDGIRANITHAGRPEMRPGQVRRRSNGMVAVTLTRLPYGAGEYRVELYVAGTFGARQIHDATQTFGVGKYRQACEYGNALFDEYNNDHYASTCVLAA